MRTVLIIGAGFSGAACAANLLRTRVHGGLHVILVNRSGTMARGLAYGTQSRDHLLNVPAGNMSALPHDPHHFLRFCQRERPDTEAGTFVSRRLYGDYLEWMLREAEACASADARLTRIVGEVRHIKPDAGASRVKVTLADGCLLDVDRVVLGFGNLAPRTPEMLQAIAGSERYVRDPWGENALDALDTTQPIILLGTGLTAVDVAARLLRRAPARPLYAVSRRGLLPQAHRDRGASSPPVAVSAPSLAELGATVREQVRALRQCVERAQEEGQDWRDVIASLRPITPAWWQSLSPQERSRFLRHLQPYWDTHRHRMAPAAADAFAGAVRLGFVHPMAARLVAVGERPCGVDVTLRPRGAVATRQLKVGAVVNCTGPDSDLRRVTDPLVRQLLEDSIITVDQLGLGLDVTGEGAVLDVHGAASELIFYVGPLLKARDWEATAVPELRLHAQRAAETIAAALAREDS
ncbi:FAD/NAD(P)-binding protein [Telluria sp. Tellsp104]